MFTRDIAYGRNPTDVRLLLSTTSTEGIHCQNKVHCNGKGLPCDHASSPFLVT